MRQMAWRSGLLCVVAVLVSACGSTTESAHSTSTTRPPTSTLLGQVVDSGHLTFKLPSSWLVSHGTCRCGWGEPATATLDNGPPTGGVACSCPAEVSSAPSGLHLYEGQGGLLRGGTPTTVNGVRALVSLDLARATLTATFPDQDQWISISPAPSAKTIADTLGQATLERQILATVNVIPANSASS